jgi:hypothetical protein
MPDQLSAREQCAWRFTRQLTAERHVGQALYDDAVGLLGTHGIVDMLHLIGRLPVRLRAAEHVRHPRPARNLSSRTHRPRRHRGGYP